MLYHADSYRYLYSALKVQDLVKEVKRTTKV
jgi:hypothetical protein